MSEEANKSTEGTLADYVKDLQDAVQRSPELGDDVKAQIKAVNDRFCQPQLNLMVRCEPTGDDPGPSLRVTHPSRHVASVEIPTPLEPKYVEFYMTRPRADRLAETRLLGLTKYKDGDGKWNMIFTTERFANRLEDPVVIHAEVLDEVGRMVAACAVGVIS